MHATEINKTVRAKVNELEKLVRSDTYEEINVCRQNV